MFRLTLSVVLVLAISASAKAADESPLTVAVSNVGNFAKGGPWYLSVNSAGKAELTIEPGIGQPKRIQRQFDVTQDQLAEFRKALDREKFFDLAEEYGQRVPDGSIQTLTVVRGGRAKSIKLQFLMNWVVANDKEKLRDPSRAIRLLVLISGWINDSEINDPKFYQRVLDVVSAKKASPLSTTRGEAIGSDNTKWIAAALLEMQTIKKGNTRADLLKVFREEGGLSHRTQRRYAYRDCPYIKADVTFEPVGDPDAKVGQESSKDTIRSISQPFLEWSIND
jgi:hypothetical protein